MRPLRERQGGSMFISQKVIFSLCNLVLLMSVSCCVLLVYPSMAMGITPEEFSRLSEDQQKTALLEGVQKIRQKCANISLRTTTRVQKVDVDTKTMKVSKILEDYGRNVFELRRIDDSYRLVMALYRPNNPVPTNLTVDHYNAESGVNRGIGIQHLANGKDQEYGLISKEHTRVSATCAYKGYLGGLWMTGYQPNDYYGVLLANKSNLQVRGIDSKSGLVKADFTCMPEKNLKRTGSYKVWLDLEKDWMMIRREADVKDPTDSSFKDYQHVEMNESKLFDGVWMPTRITEVNWLSEKGLATPVGNLWETTAEDIKFGKVKKEDLEVIFPPGAKVRDDITGERWGVGKSGEKIEYNERVGE
jgi:hypothetical protein